MSPSSIDYRNSSFATRCIHAGTKPDRITGAVTTPISLATTFVQPELGRHTGFEYSRTGNPTRAAFEEAIALCESAQFALAFASGSAVTSTLASLWQPNDHILLCDDVYGGTNRYFNKVAKPVSGLDVEFVDCVDVKKLKQHIKKNTKMLWLETPTNPTLKLIDISAAAQLCKEHNIICVVDNTFCSPALQNPLLLGADVVVHSVTKYIGGHSDVVMGVLATSRLDVYEKCKFLQNAVGAVPAPFDCYMAQRGLKTLHLRMKQHSFNGMAVARYLQSRKDVVEKVIYPGLESHPQHQLAKKQMRDFGGMVTFFLRGGLAETRAFLESVRLFALAESLGAVECLAEAPSLMTHAAVPPEQRKLLGISDTLVRLSVGCEDPEDILADLKQALDRLNAQTLTAPTQLPN